jgi:hypothetical protein
MNASVISALAALAGAAIGGLTSVLASWWTQQIQAKVQWLASDKTFLELREMVNSGSLDLLGDFSETCRAEFESLRAEQF